MILKGILIILILFVTVFLIGLIAGQKQKTSTVTISRLKLDKLKCSNCTKELVDGDYVVSYLTKDKLTSCLSHTSCYIFIENDENTVKHIDGTIFQKLLLDEDTLIISQEEAKKFKDLLK